MDRDERQPITTPAKPMRKRYAAPVLVEYGSVAKLTLGGTGPSGDGMSTMAML